MKRKWILALFVLISAAALISVVSVAAMAAYALDWWTAEGGGGTTSSSGGGYTLGGTIGQPDAGSSSGGDFTLEGGFWNAGMNTPGDQTLSVSKVGSGSVTSAPPGIDCGSTCEFAFPYNQSVILTASPATDWSFTGWSDTGCPGTGTCTVMMDVAKSVTATFTRSTYRIFLPLINR